MDISDAIKSIMSHDQLFNVRRLLDTLPGVFPNRFVEDADSGFDSSSNYNATSYHLVIVMDRYFRIQLHLNVYNNFLLVAHFKVKKIRLFENERVN